MKKKNRIISILLILSIVLSLTTVFITAEEKGEQSEEATGVIINRGFEEGWSYLNGFTEVKEGNAPFSLNYRKISPSKYNYFLTMRATGNGDEYLSLNVGDFVGDKMYLEFDIAADIESDIGPVLTVLCPGRGTGRAVNRLVSIEDGRLYLLGEDAGQINEVFVYVGMEFDFTYSDDEYKVTAFYGDGESAELILPAGNGGYGLDELRFGFAYDEDRTDRAKETFYLDNIRAYGGDDFTTLEDGEYGREVNEHAPITEDIQGSSSSGSGSYYGGKTNVVRTQTLDNTMLNTVMYNRNFSEGWKYDNGFNVNSSILNGNLFELEYDFDSEFNEGDTFANYYLKYTQLNNKSGRVDLNPAGKIPAGGKVFLEFDVMANEGCNLGMAMHYYTPGDGTTRSSEVFLQFKSGSMIILGNNVGPAVEQWTRVSIMIDYDYAKNTPGADPLSYKIYCYYGSEGYIEKLSTIRSTTSFTFHSMRIGTYDNAPVDHWFAIDNLKLYCGTEGFANIAEGTYGELVDDKREIDFDINSSVASKTVTEIYDESLTMKLWVDHGYTAGSRVPLLTDENGDAYGMPISVDGMVMIPMQTLMEFTGVPYTWLNGGDTLELYSNDVLTTLAIGKDVAVINNRTVALSSAIASYNDGTHEYMVISMEDVETIFSGFYVNWDEMGLITISKYKNFVSSRSTSDLEEMLKIMKKFIFDPIEEEFILEQTTERTNNFTHPYIVADQDDFDRLYDAYHLSYNDEGYDLNIVTYIDAIIKRADNKINNKIEFDSFGNYVGLKPEMVPVNPYPETGGYDPDGGRLNVLSSDETGYAAFPLYAAFAYNVTHEEKYLRFTYDYTYALCQWEHWGPGHFLNVAHTSQQLALVYDWMYNAWVENGLDPEPIQYALYWNGVYDGWRDSNRLPCEHPSWNWNFGPYHVMINNWNPSCTVGMLYASLAVMDNPEYQEKALWLMADNLYHLPRFGMDLYAPDGSYIESSGYWEATNYIFQVSAACVRTMGTDFNLMNAWGLDRTCYYACHAESSDYNSWNYHDDSLRQLNSSMYSYVGYRLNDYELIEIRRIHLQNGKEPTWWDLFYYYPELGEEVELTLDYYMRGIHAATFRDSWDTGALYTGLMGGANDCPHGQTDSGNFIYENGGFRWFADLGMESYTVAKGSYYRKNAEGQNVVCITTRTDLEGGQLSTGEGIMTEFYSTEAGGYAILDNTSAYGGYATSAKRGILVTNDRKTTIIQDQISFNEIESVYWFGHYNSKWVKDVTIADSGLTAYMTSADEKTTLRVSLVSTTKALRFTKMTCYDFVLASTKRPGESQAAGGTSEQDRSSYSKLAIKGNNVLTFNCAVVMELVDRNNEIEVGYSWTEMKNWAVENDDREYIVKEETVQLRSPSRSGIVTFFNNSASYLVDGKLDTSSLEKLYKLIGDAIYSIDYYGRDKLGDNFTDSINRADEFKAAYDAYIGDVNATADINRALAAKLVGQTKNII